MKHTLSTLARYSFVLAVLFVVSGCSYFVQDLSQFVEAPSGVAIKPAPEVKEARAAFKMKDRDDHYTTRKQCGYYKKHSDLASPDSVYRCYNVRVWKRSEIEGDVDFTFSVKDPYNDLHNPTTIKLLGVDYTGADYTSSRECPLEIYKQDIIIRPEDMVEFSEYKMIRFTLKDVEFEFDHDCRKRSGTLRLRLLIEDQGVEVFSSLEERVLLSVDYDKLPSHTY